MMTKPEAEAKLREANDALLKAGAPRPTRFLVSIALWKALGEPSLRYYPLDGYGVSLTVTSTNPTAAYCTAYAES